MRVQRRNHRLHAAWAKAKASLSILTLGLIAISCAPQTSSIATDCVINTDQASLFIGHWSVHPIPLAVVVNDFNSSELAAIESSIGVWNDFFSASKGYELYLSGSSTLSSVGTGGTRVNQSTVCGTSLIGANGFTNKIMIYKNTTTWTYGSALMALTSTCPIVIAGSTYKKFTAAVMEVNYKNFFNAGQPIPDLQSIVTHELGHVLGLNHSCVGTGCNGASDDYVSAIMYPSLGFDGSAGRIKRDLTTNDQQRANCLY